MPPIRIRVRVRGRVRVRLEFMMVPEFMMLPETIASARLWGDVGGLFGGMIVLLRDVGAMLEGGAGG